MDHKPVKIAFVGCLHGRLSDIYTELQQKEYNENIKIDLVICCGDFQSVRTEQDLKYMSVPDKYLEMGQFYLYYSGQKKVPYLTIFIGGNHEASNVLDEYHYGGYICENIFYLGRAGVINFKGLRIGGISGIYKEFDYKKGHFERNLIQSKKSIYHNREFEVAKLSQLTGKIDIMLSHDWPNDAIKVEDYNLVCSVKRHFRKDLEAGEIGSPATQFLLEHLKPRHWVCAHMHYYYQTMIKHDDGTYTQLTTLDKIVKKRCYMIVVDIFSNTNDSYNDNTLYYDNEWLSISKVFNDYIVFENKNYDYSSLIRNIDLYNKFIKKTSYTTMIMKEKDFEDNLKFYKEKFEELFKNKEESIWKYRSAKENREYFINLLGIYDSYKYKEVKKKPIISNKEEMDIEI